MDISKGDPWAHLFRLSGIMAAVTLAGAALTTAAPAAQAQAMPGGLGTISVPCSTAALITAINTANTGGGATAQPD